MKFLEEDNYVCGFLGLELVFNGREIKTLHRSKSDAKSIYLEGFYDKNEKFIYDHQKDIGSLVLLKTIRKP